METQNTNALSNEEKLFSLFSHLSFFFGSLILPLIFWIINKEKSKFASFNSLQALFFHLAFVVIMIVLIVIIALIIFATGMADQSGNMSGSEPSAGFIIAMILLYGVLFFAALIVAIYSVYYGIKSYKGEIKKYPVIGNIIYKKIYGTS